MRRQIGWLDTTRLAWRSVNETIETKLLNGDPGSGAHTTLLRSRPRLPGAPRGQYHPVDEEFFCLEGGFTFDGITWFGPNSYACFPAYTVHGSKVHVRDGYFLYLRMSGAAETHWVDHPVSDAPYHIDPGRGQRPVVQIPDVTLGTTDRGTPGEPRTAPQLLSAHPTTGEGTSLVSWSRAEQEIELLSPLFLEIFILDGWVGVDGHGRVGAGGYTYLTGSTSTARLEPSGPARLLVSHGGPLSYR